MKKSLTKPDTKTIGVKNWGCPGQTETNTHASDT